MNLHDKQDMDWHTTGQWGGYSWNRTLFPNVDAFITGLHNDSNPTGHPLKLLLNLHPGVIGPTEDQWVPFIQALGYKNGSEPFTNKSWTVGCALNNRTYATALFSEVLGSFTPQSSNPNYLVDYWWTDWGGCQVRYTRSLHLRKPTTLPLPIPSRTEGTCVVTPCRVAHPSCQTLHTTSLASVPGATISGGETMPSTPTQGASATQALL
jgi:hypothetical protein